MRIEHWPDPPGVVNMLRQDCPEEGMTNIVKRKSKHLRLSCGLNLARTEDMEPSQATRKSPSKALGFLSSPTSAVTLTLLLPFGWSKSVTVWWK